MKEFTPKLDIFILVRMAELDQQDKVDEQAHAMDQLDEQAHDLDYVADVDQQVHALDQLNEVKILKFIFNV